MTPAEAEQNKRDYPPGTDIAKEKGCKCPKDKNCDGKGYQGRKGVWVIETECPIHYFNNKIKGKRHVG